MKRLAAIFLILKLFFSTIFNAIPWEQVLAAEEIPAVAQSGEVSAELEDDPEFLDPTGVPDATDTLLSELYSEELPADPQLVTPEPVIVSEEELRDQSLYVDRYEYQLLTRIDGMFLCQVILVCLTVVNIFLTIRLKK